MIKIFNKEKKLNYISLTLHYLLKNNGLNVERVDCIDTTNDDDIYIIIGGEYIIDVPKHYIIYQMVPTSHLTLTHKTEGYWYDLGYLELLKRSKRILDTSLENIKVWNDFYDYNHTTHINFHYSPHVLFSNYKIQYEPNKVLVLEHTRSKKLLEKYKNTIFIKYTSDEKCINELRNEQALFIYFLEYENTMPNIEFLTLLRHNNIPCIVEKGRDLDIVHKAEELGCLMENGTRMIHSIPKYISQLKHQSILIPSRTPSYELDKELLDCLKPFNDPNIICKRPKLKLYERNRLQDVEFNVMDDGAVSLVFSDIQNVELPKVSICTPTYNRRWLFPLAIRNFLRFNYPQELIEWVIIDDGTDGLEDIIPRDNRVKYIHLDDKCTISDKRNMLVEHSSNDIIVFMDDDDYYPPESILARVKSLIKYKDQGVECVGCTDVANYDIIHNRCAITSNGENYLCESSLTFTRSFWEDRKFPVNCNFGEFKYFLEYRQSKIRTIPFQFVTIALYHGKNTTSHVRSLGNKKWNHTNHNQNIVKEIFENDEDFIDFIRKIKIL